MRKPWPGFQAKRHGLKKQCSQGFLCCSVPAPPPQLFLPSSSKELHAHLLSLCINRMVWVTRWILFFVPWPFWSSQRIWALGHGCLYVGLPGCYMLSNTGNELLLVNNFSLEFINDRNFWWKLADCYNFSRAWSFKSLSNFSSPQYL